MSENINEEVKAEDTKARDEAVRRQQIVDLKKLRLSSEWLSMVDAYEKEAEELKKEIMEKAVSEVSENDVTVSENVKDLVYEQILVELVDKIPKMPSVELITNSLLEDIEKIKHNRLVGTIMNMGMALVSRSAPLYTKLDLKRHRLAKISTFPKALDNFIGSLEKPKEKKDDEQTEWGE